MTNSSTYMVYYKIIKRTSDNDYGYITMHFDMIISLDFLSDKDLVLADFQDATMIDVSFDNNYIIHLTNDLKYHLNDDQIDLLNSKGIIRIKDSVTNE